MAADYSFWLLPEEPLKQKLKTLIDKLAAEHGAATFEPHVTLHAGAFDEDEVRRIARGIADQNGTLALTPQGLKQSDLFTKTFYVQFAASELAIRLGAEINQQAACKSDYRFDPHLSLLYQRLPTEERERLCITTKTPQGPYRFDALRVVRLSGASASPEDVRNWHGVFHAKLKQA